MQAKESTNTLNPHHLSWVSLSRSTSFLLGRKRLIGLSLLLFLITIVLTWVSYHYATAAVDSFTASFFQQGGESTTALGWLKHEGMTLLHYLYRFITCVISFYLAFLLAYTLCSPGYSILSNMAEKIWAKEHYEEDEGISFSGLLVDLVEAVKIAVFGLVITILALFINLIPLIGQLLTFLLYTYYSALMFLDYPASRRRWSLGHKLAWLSRHGIASFRMGLLPALLSLIPFVNIFFIALLFPLLTIYTTLNFTTIEFKKKHLPTK